MPKSREEGVPIINEEAATRLGNGCKTVAFDSDGVLLEEIGLAE